MPLFPHSSPKAILAEGLPAFNFPGVVSFQLSDSIFQLQKQAHRLWKEPQHAGRSQCSRENSPCLPNAASHFSSCKGLALGHREPALASVGPVDRLCPLLAERDAARLPARAKLLGGWEQRVSISRS